MPGVNYIGGRVPNRRRTPCTCISPSAPSPRAGWICESPNRLNAALQLYGLQNDRGDFSPYESVPVLAPPTRTGSPAGGPGGRLRAPSMQWLKAAVELQRPSPAAMVRRWRRSEKGRSRRGKQNLANSCKTLALFSISLAFSGATARVRARTNVRANEFPSAELHSGC